MSCWFEPTPPDLARPVGPLTPARLPAKASETETAGCSAAIRTKVHRDAKAKSAECSRQRGIAYGKQPLRRIDEFGGLLKQRIEYAIFGKQRLKGGDGRHASVQGFM